MRSTVSRCWRTVLPCRYGICKQTLPYLHHKWHVYIPLTELPLQASILLLSEQAATLDFSKWHFDKSSLFYSLHVNDITELHFPVHYILISLVYGGSIRRNNHCFRIDAMSH